MAIRIDPDWLRDPNGPVVRWLNGLGVDIEAQARQQAPVDTGRLRSSIEHYVRVEGGAPALFVGSRVEYAAYAHRRGEERAHWLLDPFHTVVARNT